MDRYTVESVDPYDMEHAKDGMWVMYDDAQAAIDAAVFAERERCAKLCEDYARLSDDGSLQRQNFKNCAAGMRGPNVLVTGAPR